MKSALILNGFTRNSLAITRSLGKLGIMVDLFSKHEYSASEDRLNTRFRSKYVNNIYLYRKDEKLKRLVEVLESGNYDYMFAGGTADSIFMAQNEELLSQYCSIASESLDKVLRVHDKLNAAEELSKLGVPVPQSFSVSNIDSLKSRLPNFDPPYILKFPDSYASKGLVVYEGSKENLHRYFSENYSDELLPMIQQRVSGALYDTTCFSQNGRAIGVLCQKRLLTAWIDGGGGIINQTTNNEKLIRYSKTILEHFGWNGHLEMDWIYDEKDDEYYFLEMNPKYWGTTQLTIDAGFDFPAWSIDLLDGKKLVSIEKYKVGLTFRWIEDELSTLLWNEYSFKKGVQLWMMFILRFLNPGIHSNAYLFTDPWPLVGGLNRIRLKLFDIWKKRFVNIIQS